MSDNETSVTSEEVETSVEESETSTTESEVVVETTETTEESETSGEEETTSESSEEEGETKSEESETSEDEAVSGNKAKKRIGKLTRDNYTLEQENKRLREAQEQATPTGPTERPKEEDYADVDKFVDDLYNSRHDPREAARKDSDARVSSANQAKERVDEFEKRADVARKTYEDFDEVAQSPEMIEFYSNDARHIAEIIEGNAKGPEIAYYLGGNPGKAVELAKMSPLEAAVEIGKIELKLSTELKPKSVSKAPTPITTTAAKGSGELEKDPDKMTNAEWQVYRNKTKKIK